VTTKDWLLASNHKKVLTKGFFNTAIFLILQKPPKLVLLRQVLAWNLNAGLDLTPGATNTQSY